MRLIKNIKFDISTLIKHSILWEIEGNLSDFFLIFAKYDKHNIYFISILSI